MKKEKAGGAIMSIHESGEMYLEAILVLSRKNGFVRSIDVSEYLGGLIEFPIAGRQRSFVLNLQRQTHIQQVFQGHGNTVLVRHIGKGAGIHLCGIMD